MAEILCKNNEITTQGKLGICLKTGSVGLIKVGSRDSELAMKQTHLVLDKLKVMYPDIKFETECMKTLGDKILDVSLSKIGSKALFTKELEVALEKKCVDFVVHSLKDLPTILPKGMVIGAVCERENPQDAVILHSKHKGLSLSTLPKGSVIGTSSLRRVAQLKRKFPLLKFESIRGNLNTRLSKLESHKYDAIILAAAGVIRMGWEEKIAQLLESDDCMYAVGQGALAVECREDDLDSIDLLAPLGHRDTLLCVVAERSLMRHLEGGCSVPLGVHCKIEEGQLTLRAGVWSLDGSQELVESLSCPLNEAEAVEEAKEPRCGLLLPDSVRPQGEAAFRAGRDLAQRLLERGAKDVLDEARAANLQPPNQPPTNSPPTKEPGSEGAVKRQRLA